MLLKRRSARILADRRPPETLTETARNQRLRAQREEAWRKAEVETRYWKAKIEYDEAQFIAARHGIIPALGGDHDNNQDRRTLNVQKWRKAQLLQMLTPAPTVEALTWKRQAFASRQYEHIGMDPERIQRGVEQSIEEDAAWLKAHPTRRPRNEAPQAS